MFADALTVIEVIAEATRPQWESRGLKYEEFAELLVETDERLLQVQKCFVQGLTDFFRRIGDGALALVVEKAMAATEKAKLAKLARIESPAVSALIEKALAKEESEFQKLLDAEGAKLSGETSTSAPV